MRHLAPWLALLVIGCGKADDTGSVAPATDSEAVVEGDESHDEPSAEVNPHEPLDTDSFVDPKECAACHPTQYEQWETSMHRYAPLSPVFDAMAAKAFRDTAGEVGTFCTGCHSPIGTYEGEEGWTVAADRSAKSKEGVSCDYCHSVTNHTGILGNGNLEAAPSGVKYGSFESNYMGAHTTEKSDFIQSPEMCGSCHDVFMFPGIQIEQAYTEYAESPAAAEGVRCQDCHMGSEPGVVSERPIGPAAIVDGEPGPDRVLSNHSFVGPDYALIDTFPYEDDLEASAAAQAEYMTRVQTLMENAAELGDLDVMFEEDADGGAIMVSVRSLTAGHRIPTGFTSERQMWVAVTVENRDGDVVWSTGDLDEQGDLRDEHSWAVKSGEVALDTSLVNFQSKNVTAWRPWNEAGVFTSGEEDIEVGGAGGTFLSIFPFDALAVVRNSIEPLEERELVYSFEGVGIEDVGRVDVALYYRNLPPYLLRALQLDDLVERLHVITIDTAEIVFE